MKFAMVVVAALCLTNCDSSATHRLVVRADGVLNEASVSMCDTNFPVALNGQVAAAAFHGSCRGPPTVVVKTGARVDTCTIEYIDPQESAKLFTFRVERDQCRLSNERPL